jgi:asparagine synthase (glutamine-hydrolysing)
MCGIAGIICLDGVKPKDLLQMSVVLKHRGPDDEGFAIIDANGKPNFFKGNETIVRFSDLPHISEANFASQNQVGLVHRRLSILDLSPAGHQPMSYKNDNYQLAFNGEIYNYKEIKANLLSEGYQFVSDSDTEVILAAYDKWGKHCVDKFVGMWAFALYDKGKKQLFLSRDRFGIKPLYYSFVQGNFAFASEIKALLSLDFVKPEAKMPAVYEFISFGATSDPSDNLFKQVYVLPPAHNLFVNLNDTSFVKEEYYNLEDKVANYELPSDSEIEKTFATLLNNSIDLHLRADVPIGSALSGGLDSSTLVAMAAGKMGGTSFKTFTAAYKEKNIDESDFAKKVIAQHKNIEGHFTYPDNKGYWEDLEKLIWHQDLPINSTSMFAQWEVMKLAKHENIKVLLDGQGADEILGGYYNFAGIYLIELLKYLRLRRFLLERKALQTNFAPNINMALGKAAYYFLPEALQRSVRSKGRLGMNFISGSYKNELAVIKVPARGGNTFKAQSLLSTKFGLQDLLRYEDRNSMAFSIESRVPFLDHRLVEFSIALKNDWKIKNGWTKYILRKTAEPVLDKEVVWRKYKMGFLTPQKEWKTRSQKELNDFVNETEVPKFIDKKYLVKLNSADLTESAHLSEFWKMISFLKWVKVFKVTFD